MLKNILFSFLIHFYIYIYICLFLVICPTCRAAGWPVGQASGSASRLGHPGRRAKVMAHAPEGELVWNACFRSHKMATGHVRNVHVVASRDTRGSILLRRRDDDDDDDDDALVRL